MRSRKRAQRRAAPFADHAPALDADMARDLADLRQRVEFIDGPGPLVVDPAGQLQAIIGGIEARCLVRAVPCIVTEILHRHRLGKCRRQTLLAEQRRLHRVVPRGEAREHALHRVVIAEVAAGEQRQRAERQPAAQRLASDQRHRASSDVTEWRGSVARPTTMASSVRGTSSVSATCTSRKNTMPAITRKCTMRAPWKPPNSISSG